MSNEIEQLIEKDALTSSSLVGGATLNAEQREELANLTIDAMKIKDHVTVEKVYDRWEHDSLELTGRFAELDNGQRSDGRQVSTYKLEFDPVDVKAVLRLHRTYLRRLATKPGTKEEKAALIYGALAVVLGNDAERMVWSSNELGHSIVESVYKNDGTGNATQRVKDETFAKFNGVIASGDISGTGIVTYDANGTSDIRTILHNMYNSLPADYRDDGSVGEFCYYMPLNLRENLRSYLEKRETNMGDFIISKDSEITFRGISVVGMPLLPLNPTVTEHITMDGTNAQDLAYTPAGASSFFANSIALADSATAAYAQTTDYVLDTVNKTVAVPGTPGAIGNTDTVKYTYNTLPQIYLTKKNNFIVAIGVNDMEQEDQYFANEGVLELVGRTRIAFGFVKEAWVARAINVADAISA